MISIGEMIAKLEAAQRPDRDLDCLVEAFEEKVTDAVQIVRRGDGSVAYWKAVKKDPSHPVPEFEMLGDGKPYTSSLDEAIAFAVRIVPGKWSDALREALSALGRRHAWHICPKSPGQERELPREVCLQALRIKADSTAWSSLAD
jgi:hypothetical protein